MLDFVWIITIVCILAAIAVAAYVYGYVGRKGFHKAWRLLALLPLLGLGFFLADSFYTTDRQMIALFKELTEMSFPESAEFIAKRKSQSDEFGDFSASFLVKMNQEDLERLENQVQKLGFQDAKGEHPDPMQTEIEQEQGISAYARQYFRQPQSDRHYFVGFLPDNKSVLLTFQSW